MRQQLDLFLTLEEIQELKPKPQPKVVPVRQAEIVPVYPSEDPLIREAIDHIAGRYDYRIDVRPRPTPRPRASLRMMGGKPRVMVFYHNYL